MTWRRRLMEFPGGILETNVYEGDLDDSEADRADMRWKPTALGYIRTDVSGLALLWDQSRIRRLAERLGYDFADMVVYDPKFGRAPLARLKAQATRLDAEAVIVPGPEHFEDGQIPGALVAQLDVITVQPEETYARRAVPALRRLPGAGDGA